MFLHITPLIHFYLFAPYQSYLNNSTILRFVPELCYLTGITETMRKDVFFMKELAVKTNLSPQHRIKKCKEFLDKLTNNSNCQRIKTLWKISIEDYPQIVEGAKLYAGKLLMQAPIHSQIHPISDTIDLEESKNLDRETQRPMLSTPPFQQWEIIQDAACKDLFPTFKNELYDIFQIYKINNVAPIVNTIDSIDPDEWISKLERLTTETQAVIIVLRTDKSKTNILYNTLKRYFLTKKPIPTQFVLSRTLERSKNLRSICCKIVIQLCVKLGGIPWEITDVPLTQFPIMVIGLTLSNADLSPIRDGYRVLSLVATLNKGLSRCFSSVKLIPEKDEIDVYLQDVVARAMGTFKTINKCYPKSVIVYRECVNGKEQSASNIEFEVNIIKKVLQASALEDMGKTSFEECSSSEIPKLTYILAQERSGFKFYEASHENDLRNPMPGCMVYQKVARKEKNEFYMVSQRSPQGFSIPTHYLLCFSNEKSNNEFFEKLISFTHKLCFLYYNISGPVRFPAPLQYAIKLCKLLFQRSTFALPPPIPNQRLENLNVMYYL